MTDNNLELIDDLLGPSDDFEMDFLDPGEPNDIDEPKPDDTDTDDEPSDDDVDEPKPEPKDDDEPIDPLADDDDDDEPNEDDIHSTFEMVAKGLQKLGKFDIPEGAKLTEESFLELYDNFTKEKAREEVENFVLAKHGEEGLEAFQDIFVKGTPIKEYLKAYQENTDFESIELEDNLYNQKAVVRRYLAGLDWEEGDIEEHIDSLIEGEKLESMATKYKTKVASAQKAQREALAKRYEDQDKANKLAKKKRIEDLTEAVTTAIKAKEINGIPLSTEDSKTLLHYVTADAYRLPNGTPITTFDKDYLELKKDPVKFAALAKLVKDGLNITPIKKSGAEELSNKAFEFRTKKKTKKKSNPNDLSWLKDLAL